MSKIQKASPLISTMITSYNQRDSLIRALESILNQTYKNIQIVIADDCTTKDDSKEIILDYQKKYGTKIKPVFQQKNIGIPRNKNAGFKACDGDYITYLDGDDFYYPEKIEREVQVFQNNKEIDIVYSNFAYTNIEGQVVRHWAGDSWSPREGDIFKYVYARLFPHQTLYRCELMKKKVLQSIDYYNENIPSFHDWDSRIRMSRRYNIAYSNYIGSAYVDDPTGISKTKKMMRLFEEMQMVYEKNKPLLEARTPAEKKFIIQKIEHFFSKLYFSTYPKKARDIFQHFSKYPKDIIDIRFIARLILGDKIVEQLKK